MATETPRKHNMSVDEAMDWYDVADRERQEFMLEYAEWIKRYNSHNHEVDEAKAALTEAMYRANVKDHTNGRLKVKLVTQRTVSYDVDELPPSVTRVRGLVETTRKVNKSVLEKALKNGKINQDDILEAQTVKDSKPYVKITADIPAY